MTETWDVAQYVESHPEDSKQRWRLAKKYYQDWEYRLALEHLLLLKNEWPDNLKVRRYAAATYFRLERYDDAVSELKKSIEQWPRDVSLYEQLAKAYQGWGKPLEASDALKTVAEIDPSHRFAARISKRLLKEAKREHDADRVRVPGPPVPKEARTAPPSPPARSCPECGAKNGPEFERCWQCHAPLSGTAAADRQTPGLGARGAPSYLPVAGGAVVAALLTLGLYLTLRHFLDSPASHTLTLDAFTLSAALSERLGPTQVLAGIVLLLVWPIAVRIGIALIAEEEEISSSHIVVAGLLPASAAYALSWLPAPFLWAAPVGGLATALVLSLWGLGIRPRIGAVIWATQIAFIAVAMATVAAAMQGFGFLAQWPTIYEANLEARDRDRAAISSRSPATMTVEWMASGSSWLDEAGPFGIQLESGALSSGIYAVLKNARGVNVLFRDLPPGTSIDALPEVDAGERYTLIIDGDSGVAFTVTLEGPLEARIALTQGGAFQ